MVYRVLGQRKSPRIASETFVIPSGFEPETHSLEGCCSIQLSYGTSADFLKSDAKVGIFWDSTKFQTLNLM